MSEKNSENKNTAKGKKSKKKLAKIIAPIAAVVLIAVALVVVINLPDDAGNSTNTEVTETKPAKISASVDKEKVHQAQPETNAKGEIEENGTGELLSYIPRQVKTIKVENTKSTYTIKSYTPVEKTTDADGKEVEETQETEYTLVGYEDFDIASGQPDMVASDIASISFTKVVSADGKNSDEFGFDKPRSTVTVTYQDNTTAKVVVGDEAPNNQGTYIQFGDNGAVYLVEDTAVDSFLFGINDLISKEVTKSADSGDNASPTKVELSGTHFGETVEFVPSDDETASSNYLINKPASYYGNDSGCSEVEAGIRGVMAKSVAYVNPGDSQMEKYGLAKPYAQVKAEYPDVKVNLIASKPDDKGYCYLMVKDGKVIYKILSDSIKWTQVTLDDLRSPYFVDNKMNSLSETQVKFGKNDYTFDLKTTESSYTDDDGNTQTSDVTTVNYNGKQISTGAFQTAFDYMHGEKFSRKEFTSENLSGNPVMTVKFSYSSDTGRSSDEMKFYDLGNQKYYITVNGEQISYVYKNAATELQKLFTTATKSSSEDDNV